jgi:hypothetical protein
MAQRIALVEEETEGKRSKAAPALAGGFGRVKRRRSKRRTIRKVTRMMKSRVGLAAALPGGFDRVKRRTIRKVTRGCEIASGLGGGAAGRIRPGEAANDPEGGARL